MDASLPPHPDACFDADWLALRAAADRAARATSLEARAAAWLRTRPGDGPRRLIDLGSGSGANPRHLAPRLPGPQRWSLMDHDAALLEHARRGCGGLCDAEGNPVAVMTRCMNLGDLSADTLAGSALVCASALLDLMSADWLEALADACAGAGCAVLITLSVDGSWRFYDRASTAGGPGTPGAGDEDDDDRFVRSAFNDHQRRDKGLGAALGPDAAPALMEALTARGFAVAHARSPWRLDSADAQQAALARALIDGWRDAARAQRPQAAERIGAWHGRRRDPFLRSVVGTGHGAPGCVLEVGHIDLFATPATDQA